MATVVDLNNSLKKYLDEKDLENYISNIGKFDKKIF